MNEKIPENVIMSEEPRGVIDKLRKKYKENYIDTGKAQKMEEEIEHNAKKTKRNIKIAGTLATIALIFIPADGPFGEIATALATPGLCALVDLAADVKKKALITGKRGVEQHFLKVDGSNQNIEAYNLTNGEIIKDLKEVYKKASNLKL